jgi:hypothetical protein
MRGPLRVKRYLLVSARNDTPEKIARYLPGNYDIVGQVDVWSGEERLLDGPMVVVAGYDNAGWTLDGYVRPRLQSGLIASQEIGLDHPVMKVLA